MNKSLNVFLIVLLCFVLYAGVLTSLYTTDDSASQHYQTEYTSSIPTGIGAPSVSFGVGARGNDLTVPMSSRPSRGSVRHLSSHRLVTSSPNSPIASSPNSLTSSPNSLITYTSSSQTMKSFGGGSNGNVSMSNGVVSSSAPSSSTSLIALSPTSPITSSPTSLIASSPTNLIASSPYLLPDGTASMPTLRGINGRHNAPGAGFGNSWIEWVENWYYGKGYAGGIYDNETNLWTVGVNNADLEAAYDAFLANWNYGLGDPPTLEQWYAWFLSNGGTHTASNGNIYNFTPVGDILPLLILAMMYLLYSIISSCRLNLSLRNNITKQ